MSNNIGRRDLITTAGGATLISAAGSAFGQEKNGQHKIVGVCCSPRKGMTTSSSLKVCLNAAKEFNAKLETELIELADYSIPAQLAAGQPLRDGETDDFPKIVEILGDPAVIGIVVGSPVYFANMSALCKAFLDRCIAFRQDGFKLRNKVAGVLAVGGTRNGGQEMTVRSIQMSLMCQDMFIAGNSQPSPRMGATLWSQNNSIDNDGFGVDTAESLGKRVAELATLISR